MTVAMVCLGVEVILLLVFAPISIKVKAHFSLSRKSCQAVVRIVGINMIRVRASIYGDKAKVLVNGKEKQQSSDSNTIQRVQSVANALKIEGIRVVPSVIALIGMDEAKNSAMICAMLCGISGIRAYPDTNCERCDIDVSLKAKVNIMQTVRLILSANK